MTPGTKLGSRFALLALMAIGTLPLAAQMFQTSFAEQKLDRSRTPVVLQGAVQVEVPTGAINLDIPLGPGIGARGATFRPALTMRMSPQARILQHEIHNLRPPTQQEFDYWDWRLANPWIPDIELQYSLAQTEFGSATLSPGHFNLAIEGRPDAESSFEVMGHGGASVRDGLPPGFTQADATKLMTVFGLEGYHVGHVKAPAIEYDLIRIASNDDLVLGLSVDSDPAAPGNDDDPQLRYQLNPLHSGDSSMCQVPRFVAVVRNDIAFLFEYLHPMYQQISVDWVKKPDNVPLRGANYRLVRIMNRFKEYIKLTYESAEFPVRYFAAEWFTREDQAAGTGPMVSLGARSATCPIPIPGTPSLRGGQVDGAYELDVTYLNLGDTAAPQFTLCMAGGSPGRPVGTPQKMPADFVGMDGDTWDGCLSLFQPLSVTQEIPAPAQKLTFRYGDAPRVTWPHTNDVMPTVLTGIDFPGGSTTLTWAPHTFRLNYAPWVYYGLTAYQPGLRRVPSFAWGVVESAVQDAATGQTRYTGYGRTLPQMNWVTNVPADYLSTEEERWVSTDFHVVVSHPDGTTTKHIFASPSIESGGAVGPPGLHDLAFIKHVEVETIESAVGTADRVTLHDHLSLMRAGNLTGETGKLTVPVATRTRSWDGETGIQTLSKKGYNTTTMGWDRTRTLVGITSRPEGIELADSAEFADLGSPFYAKDSTSILESLPPAWLIGRAIATTTAVTDPWGYNPGRTMPWQAPVETRTLNTTTNRLEGSTKGSLTTTYTFSSENSPTPSSVQVTSPSSSLSGSAGADYSYDEFGFLKEITRKTDEEVRLAVSQTNDVFGRAVAQEDASGLSTGITWDGAGRLRALTPPGETPWVYEVHPDNLGLSIKRAPGMESQLRFNAFGELVLERRKALDPIGQEIWSHRIHGRDSGGRTTGVTVWLPGKGDERDWARQNLTWEVIHPARTYDKCVEWGVRSEDGSPECLRYETFTQPAFTVPALYLGTSFVLDGRGREIIRREPLDPKSPTAPVNLITKTVYSGLSQRVTAAEGSPEEQDNEFIRDPLGRLANVINRNANWVSEQGLWSDLVSSYGYDVHGKLSKVEQTDVARGLSQTRTWTTNDYGWLTELNQPESGITSFSDFNVTGLPRTTDYAGLKVETTYDLIGRPLLVKSGNLSLQAFTYDTAPNGKGKIATGTDGAIQRSYAYNSDQGRLETLDTLARGETFRQSFLYDALGQRTSASAGRVQAGSTLADNHTTAWMFDPARGVPNVVHFDSAYLANAAHHDVSWQVASLSWASSAASFFTYGLDQSRLKALLHQFKDGAGSPQQAGWDYTYDGLGRLAGDGDDAYTYDPLNRLRSATIKLPEAAGSMSQVFDYDAFGNMISATSTNAPAWVKMGFTFSPHSVALKSFNHMPATTVSGGSTGAHYNPQGHLDQVNAGLGGRGLALTYDPLGRVTRMDRGDGITEAYQYTHDGLRTVIEEWQGSVLQRIRLNLYNDQRQMVSQWVME